jgi:hypothetical protein
MAQVIIVDEKSLDIEDFLSKDFASRVAYIRDRLRTAMRSAELARVWSDLHACDQPSRSPFGAVML